MFEKVERFIASLENTPMSIATWLAGFVGIIWIRYLIEAFSNPNVSGYVPTDLPTLLHYLLFYSGAVVITVVVMSTTIRISPLRMMRTLIFILPIMWLGPLIDLAQGGARMSYLFVTTPHELSSDFFSYFGPLVGSGVTLGMRIEFGLLILMLGTYAYLHTRSVWKGFLGTLVGYTTIFFTVSLPSLLSFFLPANINVILQTGLISQNFLHPSETYSIYRTFELLFDALMSQTWYLFLCVFGCIWAYRVQKKVVVAVGKNIRPERVGHFLVFAFLGGLVAFSAGARVIWTIFDMITIAAAVLTILFAWIFAVVVNDIADESIDIISNTDRPLVTGSITRDMMRNVALVSGLMALIGALSLGSYATFWILVFSASYYIYSAPPLRLKRVPILASSFIGIATLSMMLFGFFLISTKQELVAFPRSIALLVVIFMTLITNVRDLKDIKGDSAAGIWTLPTLLGESRSRLVIGIMMFIAYMLIPIFIPVPILWAPSFLAGIISWVGLVRGKGERFVFSVYFTYLASIVTLLYFM